VSISGSADSHGNFELKGSAAANFFIASGQANFDLVHNASGTSLTADGYFSALNAAVHMNGQVQPNGDFSISGQAYANFYIAQGNATFTFSSQGGSTSLSVDGWINALGANVEMTGQANSDGTFSFSGYAAANFYLANGTASITLANNGSGTTCDINANLNLLGANVAFQGQVAPNGDFSFSQSGSFTIPLLGQVTESFALRSSGGNFSLTCGLQGTDYIPFVPPLRAVISVSFNITADPNGQATYSGSGDADIQFWAPFSWNELLHAGVNIADHTMTFSAVIFGSYHSFSVGLP
jgi:hypothetical protein